MDRSYPHFANCATPGSSRAFSFLNFDLLFSLGFGGTVITMLISVTTGQVGCAIAIGLLIALSVEAHLFKDWYYGFRLMCIKKDKCIIGTMVGKAKQSFDGDTKFDMLVAPFEKDEVHQYIINQLNDDTDEFGTGFTDEFNINDLIAVLNYIRDHIPDEERRIELYSRVVHKDMFNQDNPDPDRDYLKHFLVRDVDEMGQEAFDHSPEDRYPPVPRTDEVNPMYRSSHTPTDWLDDLTGGSDLAETLLPFLHCELEGYGIGRLMNKIIAMALLTAAAIAAFCYLPWPANVIVGGIFLLIALLVLIFYDKDSDDSSPADAGLDQGDVDREAIVLQDDVLGIFGNWIMDEEHTKYFELHPIKAVHFILKANDQPDVTQTLHGKPPEFYGVSQISSNEWEEVCELIRISETVDPIILMRINEEKKYAMMAGLA